MTAYICRPDPWYTERWYDEDIEGALEELCIEVNEYTMNLARHALEGVFDDKSERNEMIRLTLENYFDRFLERMLTGMIERHHDAAGRCRELEPHPAEDE